jgi:hypothetical protein
VVETPSVEEEDSLSKRDITTDEEFPLLAFLLEIVACRLRSMCGRKTCVVRSEARHGVSPGSRFAYTLGALGSGYIDECMHGKRTKLLSCSEYG